MYLSKYNLNGWYNSFRSSINRMFRKNWPSSSRTGRSFNAIDPSITKKILLENYENNQDSRESDITLSRTRK